MWSEIDKRLIFLKKVEADPSWCLFQYSNNCVHKSGLVIFVFSLYIGTVFVLTYPVLMTPYGEKFLMFLAEE